MYQFLAYSKRLHFSMFWLSLWSFIDFLRFLKMIILTFYWSNNFFNHVHTIADDKFLFADQRLEKIMYFILHMSEFLEASVLMKVELTMSLIPDNSFSEIIYNIYFINKLLERYSIKVNLSKINPCKLWKTYCSF